MNVSVNVGGRHRKGDPRSSNNWVGVLKLEATREGEQFLLAALGRLFIGGGKGMQALEKALEVVAKKCLQDHRKREKRTGVSAHIVPKRIDHDR